MKCEKCGTVFEKGQFCPKCGNKLSNTVYGNNNMNTTDVYEGGVKNSNNANDINRDNKFNNTADTKAINNKTPKRNDDSNIIKWYYQMWFISLLFWVGSAVVVGPIVAIVLFVKRIKMYPTKRKPAIVSFSIQMAIIIGAIIWSSVIIYKQNSDMQAFIDAKNYDGAFEYIDKTFSTDNYEYYSRYADVYDAMGNPDKAALKILDYCNGKADPTEVEKSATDRLNKYKDKVSDEVRGKIEAYFNGIKQKQEKEKKDKAELEKTKQEAEKAKQEAEKAKQEAEKAKVEKTTKEKSDIDEKTTRKVENYSMDDFAERALNVTYKDLLRNPEGYKGECVVVSLTINNQFEDDVNQYCAFDTYSENEDYYVFNDCRKDGDRNLKLLKDDVVNVYGVFEGVDEFLFKYSLTGNEEKIKMPIIDAYYIELIKE
ncbi:hypothetical protein [Eubacterium xylanophilum]|uniref:hypothetical protein n=1 Tax=Eubacterium xylanophilum TaxID=39497 RepID=UPI000478F27C|nr:hypothetical protein [Eubacterium xylanophilum]